MISDRLFVYGTLMRGFDHPMAQLLSRSADFLGDATCRGRLYLIKHYPGLVLSDDPNDIVFGELYRLRDRDALLGEFDMYEACGAGFPEPTEYLSRMLQVTHEDGTASEAWTYVYNWPVTGLPQIASGKFLEQAVERGRQARSRHPGSRPEQDAGRSMTLPRIQPLALHADIHLALDIAPFLGGAQHARPVPRTRPHGGRVFEPGQEVEGLAEIAAVIELPGDRRQIFQAAGDVVRLVLEDLPPLLLRQLPPRRRFLDRDQRRAWVASGRPSSACTASSCFFSARSV